jgi:hypothetical protein
LVLFSGVFNVALAAPLAVPELSRRYVVLLWQINQALGLGGREPRPPADGIAALLVNTAGVDLVLIGAFAMFASRNLEAMSAVPLLNSVGRVGFALLVGYYVIAYDVARIVAVFGAMDLVIAAAIVRCALAARAPGPRGALRR